MSQKPSDSCTVVKCNHTQSISNSTVHCKESTMSPSLPPLDGYPDKVVIGSARLRFSTHIQVNIKALDTGSQHELIALLDSGATGLFLSTAFVELNNLNTRKLSRAIPVYNVDGSLNQGGSITQEVDVIMTYQEHSEKATFAVCDLGDKDAVIGHTWLFNHNPEIDWKSGKLQFTRCPPSCQTVVKQQPTRSISGIGRKAPPLPVIQEDAEEDEPEAVVNSLEFGGLEGEDGLFAYFPSSQEINATQTI